MLGTTAVNYTLVGDPGTFLQGIALAAKLAGEGEMDGCLVIGAEEMDWLTADAFRHFSRNMILADGAGALYLRREPKNISVIKISADQPIRIFFQTANPRSSRVEGAQ